MTKLSPRTCYVDALEALLKNQIAQLIIERDFELLEEVARLAQEDAPTSLAVTDTALFSSWRAAVTRYHADGWTNMTPMRVRQVASQYIHSDAQVV